MGQQHETTLNAAIVAAVAKEVEAGATIPHACAAAGLSWNTAKRWLRRGKRGESPYTLFSDACATAKQKFYASCEKHIGKADDWRARAWLLERRLPEYYRPAPQRQEHTGKDGGSIRLAMAQKTDKELDAIIARGVHVPEGGNDDGEP